MFPSYDTLSQHAWSLAASGRFNNWQEIVNAIEGEGVANAAYRLGADPSLRGMLDARCGLAKQRAN
jgi:hypothetical protein